MTSRAALNQAATRVAEQYGWRLRDRQPRDSNKEQLREVGTRSPAGYFRLTWLLVDSQGLYQADLILECEGGYGAGAGKGWFAGHVSLVSKAGNMLEIKKLVRQWDYPCEGARSAKETRSRFVTWAETFKKKA
jgi:hypothetical protein